MRSKSVLLVAAMMAMVIIFTGSALGQVAWKASPNGVALTVDDPGMLTSANLTFTLGEVSQLTDGQWLEVDLSAFTVDASNAILAANYAFASTNTSLNMDNDGSDFTVSYTASTKVARITLASELALVPAQSEITLTISNVLYNPGNLDWAQATEDYYFKVRTEDQPLWSQDNDTDEELDYPNDQQITSITMGDTVASNATYMTIVTAANGRIPKDGTVFVMLPLGYSFTASSYASDMVLKADNVTQTATVTTSGRTASFALNETDDIVNGSVLTIELGNDDGGNLFVNNPAVYQGGSSTQNSAKREMESGQDPSLAETHATNIFQINVIGVGSSGIDTLFYDYVNGDGIKGSTDTDVTYNIVSNYFPPSTYNSNVGAIKLYDSRAGVSGKIDITFSVSTQLTANDSLIFRFPEADFLVNSGNVLDANFSFSGSGASLVNASDEYDVSYTDVGAYAEIGFILKGTGYVFPNSLITMTIASTVVQNLGEMSDIEVGLKTTDQTTAVVDSDTDPILPNPGGFVTAFILQDSTAGELSGIKQCDFTALSYLPVDAEFVITVPGEFTLQSPTDVTITIGADANTISGNNITASISGNELTLALTAANGGPWAAGTTVQIDDLTDAFTNPIGSSDINTTYPSTANSKAPFIITVKDANGNALIRGDNSSNTDAYSPHIWGLKWTSNEATFNITGADDNTANAGGPTELYMTFENGQAITAPGEKIVITFPDNFYLANDFTWHLTEGINVSGAGVTNGGNNFAFAKIDDQSFSITPGGAGVSIAAGGAVIVSMNITTDAVGGDSYDGGPLYTKGAGTGLKLELTSTGVAAGAQSTASTMSTARALDIVAVTAGGGITAFTSATSDVAGENSANVIVYTPAAGGIPDVSGKIGIKLLNGFTFVDLAAANITANVDVQGLVTNATPASVTRVSSDSLVIVVGAADIMLPSEAAAGDALSITLGAGGGNELITNSTNATVISARENTFHDGGTADDEIYRIWLYDDQGRLINKHDPTADTATEKIYTNLVSTDGGQADGSPLATELEIQTANTALDQEVEPGMLVTAMNIPLSIGKALEDQSIILSFSGLKITDEVAAGTNTNWTFAGDADNANPTSATVNDSVTVTLVVNASAGDANGALKGGANDNYQIEITPAANMFTILGRSTDEIDVTVTTTHQSTGVTDATTIGYNLTNNGAQDATGASTSTVGTNMDFQGGWTDGGDVQHGMLPSDGRIQIKVPVSQDEDKEHDTTGKGIFAYQFRNITDADLDANLSVGKAAAFEVTATVDVGGPTEGANITNGGISHIYYEKITTAVATEPDTAVFTLYMALSEDIESDDGILIDITDELISPLEASNGAGRSADTEFFDGADMSGGAYHINVCLLDNAGGLIAYSEEAGDPDFDPDAHTQYVVVVNGQKHDPGGYTVNGATRGTPTATYKAGEGVPFEVLAVDDYGNIVNTVNAGGITLTLWSDDTQDGPNFVKIGDEDTGTAGHIFFANGIARYRDGVTTVTANADSLKFLKAGDGDTDYGRTWYKKIKAVKASDGTLPTFSDNITILPNDHARTFVLIEGETYTPGDSVNYGKQDTGSDVELKQGGTYSVTVYPVDLYYNRVTDPNAGALTDNLDISVDASVDVWNASGSTITEGGYTNNQFVFYIHPNTQGTTFTLTVNDTDPAPDYAGTADFDVVAALATATFAAMADSTELAGRYMDFSVELNFPGQYASGGGWDFWTHTSPDLDYIVPNPTPAQASHGAILQVENITVGEGATPAAYSGSADVAYAPEGDSLYIYAVLPDVSDSVVARSEGFLVFHHPVVDQNITAITPSTVDGDLNMDSGGSGAPQSRTINFQVIDVDDASVDVPVWVFISTDDDLDATSFDTGTATLTGATRITPASGTGALNKGNTSYLYDILEDLDETGTYTGYGDYYVYVVAYDGKNVDLERSSNILTVKHTPSITLNRPITGQTEIDTKDQQLLTINWAIGSVIGTGETGGDFDRDDNATIAIYYDATAEDHDGEANPAESLRLSATAVQITDGFEITEDPDGESDQYVWDLSTASASVLPAAGAAYDFYALITDSRDTILAKSPGDVYFTHSPKFQFNLNLGAGLSKGVAASQITVDKGEVFRVPWDASDLDQEQFIRLIITQKDTSNDYEDLTAGGVLGTSAWIMNSSNGSADPSGAYILSTDDDAYFDWYSEDMTNLTQNGDYSILAFVSNDNDNGTWTNGTTEKFVARGKVKLTGRERTTTQRWDLRALPSVVTTSLNDTVRVELVLDSDGQAINQFGIYIDVDTSLFDVYNPESPVVFNATDNFLGDETALEDTAWVEGSKWYINFEKAVNVDASEIATTESAGYIKLIAKENVNAGTVNGQVTFSSDANAGRSSFWSASGVKKQVGFPSPAVKVYHNPLGRIQGFVTLQERINNSAEITFELREIGSLTSISDQDFRDANDTNASVNGIQITTDQFGAFVLTKVPTGVYTLVANAEGYLSGQYPRFEVLPGDIIPDANPTYNNAAIPVDYEELKGGDVSSDAVAGTGDNIIDGADMTYLINNFGVDVNLNPTYAIGDVNNDGRIETVDMMIASTNFGLEGIPPIYTKIATGGNGSARFEVDGIPDEAVKDQEFSVKIWARNVDDLFGYDYVLSFDASKYQLVEGGISEGSFLRSRSGSSRTIFFTKDANKGTRVVNMLLGRNGEILSGDGVVTVLTFKSLVGGERPDIQLYDVKVGNSNAEMRHLGDVSQVPSEYKMAQNYPNPFNPETKIRFELPKNSLVTMKVYNILGQEVKTLINTEMKAGFHAIKWNGRNNYGVRVASGVYIYEIRTPEFTMAKKMLMIK